MTQKITAIHREADGGGEVDAFERAYRLLFGERDFRRFSDSCQRIALQKKSVLISGESGTGKSILAERLHPLSPRARGPMVRWGCGDFDANTINSTLFGHIRGAFTGAEDTRDGVLKECDKGTLILDDIDYLPLASQVKLLRFLDDGHFFRLGDTATPQVSDVRLIFTCNKDLSSLVRQGKFLSDLFYRFGRLGIRMPSLRQRPQAIRVLAADTLSRFDGEQHGGRPQGWYFGEPALDLLASFTWKGNIRELGDAVEATAILCRGNRRPISVLNCVDVLLGDGGTAFERESLCLHAAQSRDEQICRVLQITKGNANLTARILGCSRNTVRDRAKARGWL